LGFRNPLRPQRPPRKTPCSLTLEASALGAVEAGGRTIGVTCACWPARPNRFIQTVIDTPDLAERVARLIEIATGGYVVLPGATGTLAELAWVWEKTCKAIMARRPIVCVGDFWKPLIDMMSAARARSAGFVALIHRPDQLDEHFPRARP